MTHDTSDRKLTSLPQITLSARPVWGEAGRDGVELYDHELDPQEMQNLAEEAKHADVLARLRQELRNR